jgi:hypothetical protein
MGTIEMDFAEGEQPISIKNETYKKENYTKRNRQTGGN